MATRRSLRDRNRAAIAHEPEEANLGASASPVDLEQQPAAPEAAQKAPARPKKAAGVKATTPTRSATISGTARLGVYLTPREFDEAKAGYLADWTNGGQADTFSRWIAAAIDAYAAQAPQQRAEHATPRGRAPERTGSTKSFSIPTDTVARMRAAITADQQAGRWPSDSAWCAEAIASAVDDARRQNRGSLPTPPSRLPNRLVR